MWQFQDPGLSTAILFLLPKINLVLLANSTQVMKRVLLVRGIPGCQVSSSRNCLWAEDVALPSSSAQALHTPDRALFAGVNGFHWEHPQCILQYVLLLYWHILLLMHSRSHHCWLFRRCVSLACPSAQLLIPCIGSLALCHWVYHRALGSVLCVVSCLSATLMSSSAGYEPRDVMGCPVIKLIYPE